MIDYIELEGPQSYITLDGRRIYCKGGGGGGKGAVGMVLGVVAAVAMPVMAPAMAEMLGTSVTVGAAVAGAASGGAIAAVTGGDPLKGALMGGIGGAVGGGMNGDTWAANAASANAAGQTFGQQVGNAFTSPFSSGAGATPADTSGWTTQATGDTATMPNGFSGSTPATATINAAPSGSFVNAADPFGPTASTGGLADTSTIPGGSFDANSSLYKAPMDTSAPNAAFTNGVTPVDKTDFSQGVTPQSNISPSASGTGGSNWAGLKDFAKTGVGNATAQLGTNLAASYAMGVPQAMKAQQDALKQTTDQQNATFAQNQAEQKKKDAIGAQLQQNAAAYDPNYFGTQAAANSNMRDTASWDNYESQLRAQGRDQNYINAEKSRFGLQAGLNQGSAYAQGWNTGQNAQTSTYGAAGGMYGQMTAPSTANYTNAASNANDAIKNTASLGTMINKTTGLDTSTKTPSSAVNPTGLG